MTKKIILLLSVVLFGIQSMAYSQTDTIYNRHYNYYYSSWYDSCYAAGANSTYISDLEPGNPCIGNYVGSGTINGVYQYTSSPLEIIGIVGGLIKTDFTDTLRMPEYFMVYDDANEEWVVVDSARWDTSEVKYMALETQTTHTRYRFDTINGVDTVVEYIETVQETKYMKICEAYFKAPVTVNDSFLLGATSFNNLRPAVGEPSYDCAGYVREPTEYPTNFYSNCIRYSPIWQCIDGIWIRGNGGEYNGFYYVIFPIIKVVDTLNVIGISYDEIQGLVTGSGEYPANSRATLTAVPHEGYKFMMWNDSVTTNPRTFAVTQDTTFTAFFAPLEEYSVEVYVDDLKHGTVQGSGVYYEQSEVTISAQANEGYHFTHWNDSVTTNPRTIVLTQDTAFTAYFVVGNDSTVGINAAEANTNLFTLSPNPTTKNLQITLHQTGRYTMEIYSAKGVMLKQEAIGNAATVDVSALVPGTYVVKIYNETTSGIRTFVKQ